MENNKLFYSLEGHNSKYGVCEHRCQNGVWSETKNCCCAAAIKMSKKLFFSLRSVFNTP